jgi:sugar lactone lactonase YvrE
LCCIANLMLGGLVGAAHAQSQDQLVVGYARWDPTGNSPAPGGTALFSFSDAQGTLLWQAGVAAVEPVGSGRIFADQAGRRTALAVVNTGADPDTLILTLRTAGGIVQAETRHDFLPGQQFALFVDELFPDLPAGFTGTLSFEGERGDNRWAAVTLRQSTNQFGQPIFATLPVAGAQDPEAEALVFPQIGAGGGLSTQLVLINPHDQEIRGRIRLTSSAGTPLALTLGGVTSDQFPYVISPNGAFRGQFTLAQGVGVGYAVVELDQGPGLPAGSAVFQFTAGAATITEAGVLAARPTTRARIYADQAGTRTGVAMALPGAAGLTVTFRLLSGDGAAQQTTQRNLPPGGHLAIFVDELFPGLPAGWTGLLEIDSPSAFAAVTLKLTTNRLGQPVLTTLPVVDVTHLPSSAPRFFPQFGFGLGFATRLILLDAVSTGGSPGSLSFWRQDGTGLEVFLSGGADDSFDIHLERGGLRQLYPGVTAPLAEILMDPAELTINQGSRRRIHPILLDTQGNPRDDFPLAYQSLNQGTVTVDDDGFIEALNRGFTTLVISSDALVRTFTIVSGTISPGVPGFEPTDVAMDLTGQVFLAGGADHAILRADSFETQAAPWAGSVAQAGLVNGPRLQSRFNRPSFLALDLASGGDLYVADSGNHVIRRVQGGVGGIVATLCGSGQPGHQDGGAGQARFSRPQGVAVDDRGYLWVADTENHAIRRVDLRTGQVTTVAGGPGIPGRADGKGPQARFNSPRGLAFEAETLTQQLIREQTGSPPPPASVLVADTGNGLIRRVWEDGKVETLGSANQTKADTGTGFTAGARSSHLHRFQRPVGLALDPFGNLYVSEETSGEVKVILSDGVVLLAAERGTFASPAGMAISVRGRILVAEAGSTVRQIRYAGPSLFSVTPQEVPAGGGSQVFLGGVNFAPESVVLIGNRVIDPDFIDTTQMTFVVPELESGRQTLTILHRGGLAQGFLDVLPPRPSALPPGAITTVAGGSTYVGDGLLATSAVLRRPEGLAVTPGGDILIADSGQQRIRRVPAVAGLIHTIAGIGSSGYSGDGLPAVLSAVSQPSSLALDPEGNLYLADTAGHRIRMLEAATGRLLDVAGTGSPGFTGDGPALQAQLNQPAGVAVAPDGSIWVSDQGNHRIRRIDPIDGRLETVAGTGQAGYGGDQGPASQARVNSPAGLAAAADGSIVVADRGNHRIRVITPDGSIRTVAGTGQPGFAGDNGPAVEAELNQPSAVAADSDGVILIADSGNHRIRRISPGQQVLTTLAGNGLADFGGDGGPATAASLHHPTALAVDATGNLLVADTLNRRIRRIEALSGLITTVAGSDADFSGDGGPPGLAALEAPAGLAVVGDGLLIAEEEGHRIRFSDLPGGGTTLSGAEQTIITLAGDGIPGDRNAEGDPQQARFANPSGLSLGPGQSVLIADTGNHKLRRVEGDSVTTLAGNGQADYLDDVPALTAAFRSPADVTVDPLGGFLIADTVNHRIRRLDPQGFVNSLAGTGIAGDAGDGDQPTRARLNQPTALVADTQGRIYFCDRGNHRIRMIDRTARTITTIAGTGQPGYSGDDGPAAAAKLREPSGLALAGRLLFVGDTGNHRIRVTNLDSGEIRLLAGTGVPGFSGDGGNAAGAKLRRPARLTLDSSGNLLFSDQGNQRVRVILGAATLGAE